MEPPPPPPPSQTDTTSQIIQLPSLPPLPPLFNPQQPTSTTITPLTTTITPILAIEQPVIDGEINCFVCGTGFKDGEDWLNFEANHLLPNCSAGLLDVLGTSLGVGLTTDSSLIHLCSNCSKIILNLDELFAKLFNLRLTISRLFHNNSRPKLTLQLIPKPTPTTTSAATLNLEDLAATRSRRGRRKMNAATTTTTTATTTATIAKRKGGRPRKPFSCSICRRKFLTDRALNFHTSRDHTATTTTTTTTATTTTTTTATVDVNLPPDSQTRTQTAAVLPVTLPNTHTHTLTGSSLTTHVPNSLTSTHNTQTNTHSLPNTRPIKAEQGTATTATTTTTTTIPAVMKVEQPLARQDGAITTLKTELQPQQPQLQPQTTTRQLGTHLRPIQPKPQTVRGQTRDGSVLVVVNASETSTALITLSPNYPGLKTQTNAHTNACPVCGKVFNDEKSKKMHTIAAHRKRVHSNVHKTTLCTFLCKSCGVRLQSRRELYVHKRTHAHAQSRYTCTVCSRVFMYKYELNKHTQTHMPCTQKGLHEFVCTLCSLHVASRAALKIHVHRFHSTHTDAHGSKNAQEMKPKYLCAYCGHLSRTRKSFVTHTRTHEGENDTHTQEGPKNVHSAEFTHTDEHTSLQTHAHTHANAEVPDFEAEQQKTGNKSKKECVHCHKEMLATSIRTHTYRMHGKPVHTCTYCEERFCVRSDLMRHINAHHTAQNAYICAEPLCSEAFPTSDALRYHRNKVHSTETYTCTHCSKVYKWKGELRTHIQRAHACRERFSCPLCARSYADKRKLRQHLSVKHGSEGLDKQPEGGVGFSEDPATTTTTTTTTINENYDQETSIVAIPLYQNSNPEILQANLNGPIGDEEGLNRPITEQEEDLNGPMAGEIYLVPNLSVPIHEEQVSTS
ncbi:zinc finger protein Xfin-like [Scylla paramamosain]|uniref:zinc finger protein Xfin-like n=1 Tax=Scylla paramamosain TaxID=85552 RepID=UPI0030835790